MQLTAQMIREAFQQTQREILALSESDQVKSERFSARWERMAELLNEKLAHEYLPQEMQGDSNCEICHGAGCPNCNDTLYYEQEAVVEQYRRDQAVDRARLLHPDEIGW